MISKVYTIQFSGQYEGESHQLETYNNEYRNLMVLLKDKLYPEDFGQCGGMGRCGTCLVKIRGLEDSVQSYNRNEQNTVAKMGIEDPEIRLSCQIQVTDDLNNIFVELLENI